MKEFADKVALVWDQGLYSFVAEKLAEEFGHVLYFADWRGAFPYSQRAHIGMGLDGIATIKNPWDYMDSADLVVFPDCYYSSEQNYLRTRLGKRVWGSGGADALELYRGDLRTILAGLGMPVPKYETVVGIPALREYLKAHKNVHVKASLFRGDCETFFSPCYEIVRGQLDDAAAHLGPRQDTIEFIVEQRIDGAEFGFDGSCILGRFSRYVSWGYEAKDKGYLGQVCEYTDLPEVLRYTNNQLAPLLAELDCRGFWSTEVRGGILIDPCARAGSPPSEVYLEAFKNWPRHIYEGAGGELVDLEPACNYTAEIILKSSRTLKDFLAVKFPEELRSQIKIHGHFRQDDIDYATPLGIEEFGAAVGTGRTLAEATASAQEAAAAVEGEDVHYAHDALKEAMDKIEEGREDGVQW